MATWDLSIFCREEGLFKVRGKVKPCGGGFEIGDEETRSIVWQAKSEKGDYHAATDHVMFMDWVVTSSPLNY